MPKKGWIEVVQDICPLCGKDLPVPAWDNVKWAVEEPYCKFSGAIAIPACCNKVWITWRNTDEIWRYEVRDNVYWQFKKGAADEQLNDKVKRVPREHSGRNMLPGSDGGERRDLLPEPVGVDVQEMGNSGNTEVGKIRKMPQQQPASPTRQGLNYDF
jgi:hypothetical protein